MSKISLQCEEQEEKQEHQEEERFYESLDRILSSSNSSTSNSEDDSSPRRHVSHRFGKTKLHLSVSAQNYDVWVSNESFSRNSVDQRRDRLLQVLGLSSDDVISRRRTNRTVSFDSHQDSYCGSHIGDLGSNRFKLDQCNTSSFNSVAACSSSSSSSILSICCVSDSVYNDSCTNHDNKNNSSNDNNGVVDGGSDDKFDDVGESKNCDGVRAVESGLGSGCMNKPPIGKSGSYKVERDCGAGEVLVEKNEVDTVCTIKNLDNGKEFVVKEVKEDGTWNKLKEVGTGRQLTMEEFEMCVGHSPIVQELMRRQNVEDRLNGNNRDSTGEANGNGNKNGENGPKLKKKVSWLRSIKNVASTVAGYKERRSSDERDTSSEKGGRRSSSATDDSQDSSFHGPERVRVRQYGKSVKDLTALYKSQEIHAHKGSIWTIKFSLDGRYLATAGEDSVIQVWQVMEVERKGELLMERPDEGSLNMLLLTNGSPELNSVSPSLESTLERRRKGRTSISRKSVSLEHIVVPETVFGLSEKPVCSFLGHSGDVLDLSWSKSQVSYTACQINVFLFLLFMERSCSHYSFLLMDLKLLPPSQFYCPQLCYFDTSLYCHVPCQIL